MKTFRPEQIEYTSAAPELRDLFLAELILSGALEEMTIKLMWRLAARCAGKEPTSEAIVPKSGNSCIGLALNQRKLAAWLEEMGRDSQWLDEMLAIEAAYGAHCDTLLVPEARQRELMALRLRLTRFEIELIELESHDAAQEALFCVREDGMSMEEVATEGRYPYRRANFLLEDLPGGCAAEIFKRLARGPAGTDAAWRRIRTLSDHQKSRAPTRGSNRQIPHRPATA